MIIKSKTLIKIITFNFARAMAIYPFILISCHSYREDKVLLNHEKIHLKQQLEMLILFFYLWYFTEYLLRRIQFKTHQKAYENISFEREAFNKEKDLDFLKSRPFWNFTKYL